MGNLFPDCSRFITFLARVCVHGDTGFAPLLSNSLQCSLSKLGRIIGSPDLEGFLISTKIIHTLEDGGAARLRAEIIIVNPARYAQPGCARIAKAADELFFLGIHAEIREVFRVNPRLKNRNLCELLVSFRTLGSRQHIETVEERRSILEENISNVKRSWIQPTLLCSSESFLNILLHDMNMSHYLMRSCTFVNYSRTFAWG